jgi:hypothetical protein
VAVKVNGEPGTSGLGEKAQLAARFRVGTPVRRLKMAVVSTPALRFTRLWTSGTIVLTVVVVPVKVSLKKVRGVPVLVPTRSNLILKSSTLPDC